MTTTMLITLGQVSKLIQMSEDVVRRVVRRVIDEQTFADQAGIQKVIERGDEYGAAVEREITPIIEATLRALSLTDEYASEEVQSNYGYLSGYSTPKSIADQIVILRQFFPDLGNANGSVAQQSIPAGTEGYFAIPRWQTIAPTYGEAVEKALAALKKQREGKLINCCKGQLGPKNLRESDRKRLAFQQLGNEQEGYDVLVVAAQFGIRHVGKSVRRARVVMFGNEFGLGAFETIIMVLTHPERLANHNDLWIDGAGDEFSPDADGTFDSAPCLNFFDGEVGLGTYFVGSADEYYGSVSGLSPQ